MKPLSSALIACTLALLTMTASAQTRPCSAAEHRQFDFWLGHWDVFGPAGRKVGENLIQPILNGCALQEDWTSNGNISGRSLNLHDRATGRWHQTWVDSNGGRLELAGGLEAPGRMVLSGTAPDPRRPGILVTQRISWTAHDDGSVHQLWDSTDDGGKTWAIAFDGRYVRKPG